MPIVEADRTIALPQDTMFRLTQDYYVRLEWDPFLRDMQFLDGATEAAPGVKVWVKAWNGLTMTVEYISLVAPEVVAVDMVDGPWFLDNFAGTWRFDAVDADTTTVTFRYSFTLREAWLRPLLAPIAQFAFQRDIERRLDTLKRAAETTDIVDRMGIQAACG